MRSTARDRLLAWLLTGPVGHFAAAVADWVVLLGRYQWARLRGRENPFT
jgi:hypothetical protein